MDEAMRPFWQELQRARADAGYFPLEEARTRSWRSPHFRGARHQFVLRFEGPNAHRAADMFAQRVEAAPLDMPGYTVADVSVVSRERHPSWARLRIEVLTVKT